MHPRKSWASTEPNFCNCQKMRSTRVPWQDSHGRHQPCWVVPSTLCCLIPARDILLVAVVVDSNPFFFLFICIELVPGLWCCTTSLPESWMCLMQMLRVAGSPLFKRTVSSLTQPPGTRSCETWFYQPQLFFLLASVVLLLGVPLGFSEEHDPCRLWDKKVTVFCTACPKLKQMKDIRLISSSVGAVSDKLSGHKGRSKMHCWSKTCFLTLVCVLCLAHQFLWTDYLH